MKILLITEKFEPEESQRDGGSRLVSTLQQAFKNTIKIMQFGSKKSLNANWHFDYPHNLTNRFEQRLANADFIAAQIKNVEHNFTHVIFAHISMQFGLIHNPLRSNIQIITFPMFLTVSYQLSGEKVPKNYFEMECKALRQSNLILTPSHLEKRQLIEIYSIAEETIRVVPRGVDTQHIRPRTRSIEGVLNCCSIGSIKPQKNTLELINLFSDICNKYANATLQIIGPVQNQDYFKGVYKKAKRLKLEHAIEFKGYVPPDKIFTLIENSHLHLSTSLCETFGRSIFESLAAGLPNIARIKNNAAAEFLSHLPYVRFVNNNNEAIAAIEEILPNLPELSSLATEIGVLYNDKLLSSLLASEICTDQIMAISDFDGTLYHKTDPDKTQACIDAFRQYPVRIVCSARRLEDLLSQLNFYQLAVDWIIACSGAVVADGQGNICWLTPLSNNHLSHLDVLFPQTTRVNLGDTTIQICGPADQPCTIFGVRTEIYQDKSFIGHWEASKLHAIHKLLNHINYQGRVRVFGDGRYDLEMLAYFDGTLVSSEEDK